MNLIEVDTRNFGDWKYFVLSLGAGIRGKDVFRLEVDKNVRWNLYAGVQLGGDCLFGLQLGLGKFSGGVTVWGY